MTPNLDPANRKRIEVFKTIVADLKSGKHCFITRLTPIKSLCKEPVVAAAFTQHLASLASDKLTTRPRPSHLSKEQWKSFQRLAIEGMAALGSEKSKSELRQLLNTVRNSQNVIEHQRWAVVRLIECGELWQIEIALSCMLQESDPSRLAYDAARRHAERYDAHYGTGLLPSSVKALEQIIAFWDET